MSDKINIHQILDLFNEETGYKGLENTDKKTNDRDDVVRRQAVNNWIKEYNQYNDRPIKPKKINQKEYLYFESDIKKLMKIFGHRLKKEYLNKTIDLNEYKNKKKITAFGQEMILVDHPNVDQNGRVALSLINQNIDHKVSKKEVAKEIENQKQRVIESILNMEEVEYYAIQSIIGGTEINMENLRNDCIKKAPAN